MNCIDCPDLAAIKNNPKLKLCSKYNWEFEETLASAQKLCGSTNSEWTENIGRLPQ